MSETVGEAPAATETAQRRPNVSAELGRSLGSIWQRHAGGKPSAVKVEVSGDVVTLTMEDAMSGGSPEPGEEEYPGSTVARSPNSTRYRNEAIAAVARITRRRVRGFIPKRNATTDVATDTYILEPVHIAR